MREEKTPSQEREECPCCRWMQEEFGVLDMEPFVYLAANGVSLPDPATVPDEEIHDVLWRTIQALAAIRIFLECTDHMSDRELYEKLWHEALREQTWFSPTDQNSASHFDFSGCSGEDLERYLRYYADERQREDWLRDFPDEPMPPHEDPPHQRDSLLPRPYRPDGEVQS